MSSATAPRSLLSMLLGAFAALAILPAAAHAGSSTTTVSCPSQWTNVDNQVCSVAAVPDDGIDHVTIQIDGNVPFDSPFAYQDVTVSGEGAHQVTATAHFLPGTDVSQGVGHVNIDLTPPTADLPVGGACIVTWAHIADPLSGVDPDGFLAQYSADGTNWIAFDGAPTGTSYSATLPPSACAAAPPVKVRLRVVDIVTNPTWIGTADGVLPSPPAVPLVPASCPAVPTPGVPCLVDPPSPGGTVGGVNLDAACQPNALRLIDVFPSKKKVQLLGVGPTGSAGKKVSVFFAGAKKAVVKITIAKDLTFKALVKMPPAKIRATSRARYQAKLGKLSSAKLKLTRRMYAASVKQRTAGTVQVSGLIVRPLAPKQTINLRIATSCKGKLGPIVAKAKPTRNGTFSFDVNLPKRYATATALFLRADALVPKKKTSKKYSFTATLTRGLAATPFAP